MKENNSRMDIYIYETRAVIAAVDLCWPELVDYCSWANICNLSHIVDFLHTGIMIILLLLFFFNSVRECSVTVCIYMSSFIRLQITTL